MMPRYGMVHLRSQPFHNEHLQYVLTGLGRCAVCIIGITNPEPQAMREEPTSPHRHLQASNPYTYFQRVEMIRHSLLDENIDLGSVIFIPFDPTDRLKWPLYLPHPSSVTQFVRLFSEWEDRKAAIMESYGFTVEVLDRRAPKTIEGTQVRNVMAAGGDWEALVPRGTAKVVSMIQKGLM